MGTVLSVRAGPAPGRQEALPNLHDVVLPDAVAWMPETVGWSTLLVLAVVLSVWGLVHRHRKRIANQYRTRGLDELSVIEAAVGTPEGVADTLRELPALVRRVALSFAPRERVAPLTGEAWLAFLDEAYGGTGFTSGPGRILPQLAYAPSQAVDDLGVGPTMELLALVRTWIESHDVRKLSTEDGHV